MEGIHKSKSTLEMATNSGTRLTNQEAKVPGFGTVWYDEGAIVNIFSFTVLVEKHRITFDSSMENVFLVHQPDKIIMFMLTRRKPKPVRKDLVEIPAEITEKHHDIELCMDTMFINECRMLTVINRLIRFRSVVPIDTKTQDDCYKALDVIFANTTRANLFKSDRGALSAKDERKTLSTTEVEIVESVIELFIQSLPASKLLRAGSNSLSDPRTIGKETEQKKQL